MAPGPSVPRLSSLVQSQFLPFRLSIFQYCVRHVIQVPAHNALGRRPSRWASLSRQSHVMARSACIISMSPFIDAANCMTDILKQNRSNTRNQAFGAGSVSPNPWNGLRWPCVRV